MDPRIAMFCCLSVSFLVGAQAASEEVVANMAKMDSVVYLESAAMAFIRAALKELRDIKYSQHLSQVTISGTSHNLDDVAAVALATLGEPLLDDIPANLYPYKDFSMNRMILSAGRFFGKIIAERLMENGDLGDRAQEFLGAIVEFIPSLFKRDHSKAMIKNHMDEIKSSIDAGVSHEEEMQLRADMKQHMMHFKEVVMDAATDTEKIFGVIYGDLNSEHMEEAFKQLDKASISLGLAIFLMQYDNYT